MNATRPVVLGVIVSAALALAGCGSDDAAKVPEGVAAQVGDASINEAELDRAIAQRRAQATSQNQTFPEEGTDGFTQAQQQALQDLVLQRIVDFEAKKCGKDCSVNKKAVDDELENIVASSFNGSQEDFDEFLSENEITKPDARRIVRFNLQQEELFNRVTRGVRFTQKQAKEFYDENSAQFETPAGREVSHILVAEKEKADSLRAEATVENFGELAQANSTDPGSKDQGGSLGRISKGVFVPEFEEVAFALKDNEISDPVKTQFGWHIITVDVIPKQTTPFAEARQGIQEQQLRQARQDEFNEWRDGVLGEWRERTVYANKDLEPPDPEEAEPTLEDVTVDSDAAPPAEDEAAPDEPPDEETP